MMTTSDLTGRDERATPPVYYRAAECWSGCEDPDCPYIHVGGWRAEGIDGYFDTEAQAASAIEAGKDKEPRP